MIDYKFSNKFFLRNIPIEIVENSRTRCVMKSFLKTHFTEIEEGKRKKRSMSTLDVNRCLRISPTMRPIQSSVITQQTTQ